MSRWIRTTLGLLVLITSVNSWSQTKTYFKDLDVTLKSLGFKNLYSYSGVVRPIKVAIFDEGFKGLEEARGVTLPYDFVYHPGQVEPVEQNEHGRYMAEILFQSLTNFGTKTQLYPQELHLYNTFGISNFEAAIDDVIARGVDVVLYSEVWQLGGNGDGYGFINAAVNRATDAGVIWINAAGNFARRTYQADINSNDEGWVDLPDSNEAVKIVCQPPAEAKTTSCNLSSTLTWNVFKDQVDVGTSKDLDFVLYDDFLNLIERSTLKQRVEYSSTGGDPSESLYPREAIRAVIPRGTYYLKVKNISNNFVAGDRLRITIDGLYITMPSGQIDESVLNPADNSSVITVGASDSELSSVSQALGKPEVLSPSAIVLHHSEDEFRGSSNSAALFGAATAGLLMISGEKLGKSEIINALTVEKQSSDLQSKNINERGYDSRAAVEARQKQVSGQRQLEIRPRSFH